MFPKLRTTIVIFFTFLVSMTAFAGTNPFSASADVVVSCAVDGSQLSTFTLCGENDIRSFQVNDPDVQTIQWQMLDASSCGAATQDCPNLNLSCSWNTISTSSSFTLNNAGEYRVVLTQSNGIGELFYANANQKTYSDVVSVTQAISGNGSTDGILEISVSGDSTPYIHQLYRNGTVITGFQSSPVFTGLSAGLYQIRTRDGSGVCEYNSALFELTEPEVLAGQSILTQNPSCIQGGTIEVSASGGVPPYQFSLGGGVYTSSGVFTNLTAGSYSAQVIDANGVGVTTNILTILEPQPIVANFTTYDVTCAGIQNGQIEVEAFGGAGIYQYTLLDSSTGVPITFSSAQTGNFIFQNLAPGVYDIVVEDSGGCVLGPQSVIITEPQAMDVTARVEGVSSNGEQDGSITITTSGGTGLIQYSISPNLNEFYTSNVFTDLSAGSYTVLVQDQNGCSHILNVDVTETNVLNTTVTVIQNVSCANYGAIEVSATGGEPPYEYALDGGSFLVTNVFNGLFAGTHTVVVRDANNATATNNILIQDVPPITVNYIAQDVTCNGMHDGFILVEPVGGTGIYEYQISVNGIENGYQNSDLFEGLAPGSYDVTVRDSEGCISNLEAIVIYELPALALSYTLTNPTDANSSDGIISLAAMGGGGAYEYSIDGGVTFSSSNTFENLPVGQYQLAAIDAFVCLVELGTVELTAASQLTLTASVQSQISCNSNASVLLTPSGGVPPYEYSSNGSSYRTTNPFITGSAGNTTFTVRDATGAIVTSNSVTITAAPESISVNVGTGYDCTGVDLPRVDFQLTRGSGNMQYSIYDGIWQSETTFLDVPDGTYTARAKNESCERQFVITVENVSPVRVRLLEQNEGWARFQILSGKAPYDYRIDSYSAPRISIGNETIFEVDGLSAGPHWLVVDAANCSDHVSVDIEGFIPELEIVTEVVNSSCFGTEDASISVVGVGGLGDYNYGLVDGDNNIIYNVRPETSHFEGLAPGTYKALLRDTKLGQLVRSELITITEPAELNVTLQSTSGTAANSNNGIANLSVIGGTAPYEYGLDGETLYSSLVNSKISDLIEGNHIARIRDANGCETDIAFTIAFESQNEPSIALEIEYVNCNENKVTIIVSGGSGDYLFALDSTDPSNTQVSNVFNTIVMGSHYATVFDANGYVKTADFQVENIMQIAVKPSVIYNEDNTNASADLGVEGGSAPYGFSKDGVTYQTATIFNDLTEGNHTFYVKDALGCIAEEIVTIEYAEIDGKSIDDKKEVDIVIYQNPGRTEIIDLLWDVFKASETTISIYNGKGTLVYASEIEEGTAQTQIDVANLSRGIYFIYIKNAEMEEVKKVLIL